MHRTILGTAHGSGKFFTANITRHRTILGTAHGSGKFCTQRSDLDAPDLDMYKVRQPSMGKRQRSRNVAAER